MIALDSDVAIDILRGIPQATAWFGQLPIDEEIIIPGYAAMEIIWGTRDSQEQERTEQWLADCSIVWLRPALCERAFDTLLNVHLKNAIGAFDLLIAQVAISANVVLYSFNQKHLNVVPGLRTIRPYTR